MRTAITEVFRVISQRYQQINFRRGLRQRVVAERVGELKVSGQHADDGVDVAAEGDRLIEDAWVCAEAALPQAVAEHGDAVFAQRLLFGQEPAPQHGLDAQQREEAGGDDGNLNAFRLARAGQGSVPAEVGRQLPEAGLLIAVVYEV